MTELWKGALGFSLGLTLLFAVSAPVGAQNGGGPREAPCADPASLLKAFYDSNDAGRFDASAKYLADDVAFATWSTGVNGYIMGQRHLKGKKAVRAFLPRGQGLCHRLPGSPPDGPIYHETKIAVDGPRVRLMLEPDRKRPNGKLYSPFSIEAVVEGCHITSLTVIENITWL